MVAYYGFCFIFLCFAVEVKLPIYCDTSELSVSPALAVILILTTSNVGQVWLFWVNISVCHYLSENKE